MAHEPPAAGLRSDARLAAGRRRQLDATRGGRPVEHHRRRTPTAARSTARSTARTCRRCSARSTSPAPTRTSPQRFTTTVPQQALFLMNSPFVVQPGDGAGAAAGRRRDRRPGRPNPAPVPAALRPRRRRRRRWPSAVQFVESEIRAVAEQAAEAGLAVRLRPVRRGDRARSPTSTRSRTSPARPGRAGRSCPTRSSAGSSSPPAAATPATTTPRRRPPLDRAGRRDGRHHRHPRATPTTNGDGVRGRVVSSRPAWLGEWTVHHGTDETKLDDDRGAGRRHDRLRRRLPRRHELRQLRLGPDDPARPRERRRQARRLSGTRPRTSPARRRQAGAAVPVGEVRPGAAGVERVRVRRLTCSLPLPGTPGRGQG